MKGKMEAKRLMRMSAKQLYFLRALEMDEEEFEREALKKGEENPFLQVKSERERSISSFLPSYSSSSEEKLDPTVNLTENRESLSSVLLRELNCLKISDLQRKICSALIYNLDESGFHILSPVSAAQKFLPYFSSEEELKKNVEKCLSLLRTFEPEGVFAKDVFESLLIQAKARKTSPLCLFLLSGHLDFLSPPVFETVKEKLDSYVEEKLSSFALPRNEEEKLRELKKLLTDEKIKTAIKEIQSLNPRPAAAYEAGRKMTHYIEADLFLSFHEGRGREDLQEGIVKGKKGVFEISFTNKITISATKKNYEKSLRKLYTEATSFAALLSERRALVLHVVTALVKKQLDFFESGKPLKPFTQRELASFLGIHYSLVSRALSGKRIESERGTFALSSFFPRGVMNDKLNLKVSKVNVKREISSIIKEEMKAGGKLSDREVAEILQKKGYKIARRTVAKWRSEMGINSSYFRGK